jgi:hypothetical protein
VAGDRAGAVAEGLERADLLALRLMRRVITTFSRNAATPRKITGNTVAMVLRPRSSSVMKRWLNWSLRA